MAEGLEVVRDEIIGEFDVQNMVDAYDPNTMCPVVGFQAEGRHFSVSVSREFDEDYASGQVRVDLSRLGEVLRMSKDGKATVRRSGIS